MIELIKKPNIDFMGKRKYALTFSAALVLLGIFTIVQISLGKANLGIDFAGGTSVQIQFSDAPGLQEIRDALDGAGLGGFDLQDLPTEDKVLIRVKQKEAVLGGFSDRIIETLSANFADRNPVVDSTTEIGPKVGERLRKDALIAILFATAGILLYVAFRFQFRFGVGATVATFHDVLAVLGIFYLLGKEINLILVSALLMIAGYSLTDTVVVFDRIRENLKRRGQRDVNAVVNDSINEVLSRTIIVSLTTLLAAASLFVFGGEVIHDFSLAIILGVGIGTYSSIFVASPVVLLWGGKKLRGR
ncbi:MAG: protein translocase subunit SecF [Nitrospirota bacterium]|jgi:preprotein translocase subunit SecF